MFFVKYSFADIQKEDKVGLDGDFFRQGGWGLLWGGGGGGGGWGTLQCIVL